MRTKKIKERKICVFCGTRRYIENMYFMNYKNGGTWGCKNNDLCVIKMSYNKRKKKIKHEK